MNVVPRPQFRLNRAETASRVCLEASALVSRGLGAITALFLLSQTGTAAPLPGAITYQGNLSDGGFSANGSYDLVFSLYDAPSAGAQVGASQTNNAVSISNGLFSVSLDFGVAAFNGEARWLELSVRQGTNACTILSPRQPVAPTPYALAAAALTTPLPSSLLPWNIPHLDTNQIFTGSNLFAGPTLFTNNANLFAGAFSGDGSALTNINSLAVRKLLTPSLPIILTNYFVDFAADATQIDAIANVNLVQSTNRPPPGFYAECVCYILSGPTNRLLSFNPGWIPIGTLATNNPCLLASNKLTIVAFSSRGPSETNVIYAIARQE